MTGGILELAAKGVEDIYLTSDPIITFFKTIYRRHTNFSRSEIDLNFTNKLDFGKDGYCRLEHYGDLIHRLFLIIQLPKIEIFHKSLTIKEVVKLLDTYDIKWETNKNPLSKFTKKDYEESCLQLITDKETDLLGELENVNIFLEIISKNGYDNYDNLDKLVSCLFEKDDYNIQYKLLNEYIEDTKNNKIFNANDIKQIIIDEYLSHNDFSHNFDNTFDNNFDSTLHNIKNIIIPRKMYYFEKTETIMNYIFDRIPIGDNIQSNIQSNIKSNIQDKCSVIDILYNMPNIFGELFGPLYKNHKNLFNLIYSLDMLYNNFNNEKDVYKFMKDYIIQNSSLKDIYSILNSNSNDKQLEILNHYITKKAHLELLIKRIKGDENIIGLCNILKKSLNINSCAKFAWIKRIGHYIINQICVKINDQEIDNQYGEWLEIWHSLTKQTSKEVGYNKLIGNIKELYKFDDKIKKSYELTIPLQFWFCRNIGLSLPLIALYNSDVHICVKLRSFEEVSYHDEHTIFKNKPKLKCKILAEYIYIEEGERDKIAKSNLEYFIDVLQYNGDMEITKENMNNSDDGYIEAITKFKNPCKELFWVFQMKSFIDGSLPNNERLWHMYSYDLDGIINPLKCARIKFNGRIREDFKEIEFYNYVYPYERHNSDPSTGVNIYCFSLEPESVQPKGSVNLSMLNDLRIETNLKDIVINNIHKGNMQFRWGIYALTINILRICSGLGGLVFEQ